MVPEQAVLVLAHLDRATTELRNENLVAALDAHGYSLAILVHQTRANCQHLCLVKLLDCAVGKEDAAGGLGLSFDALHQDAVEERCEGLDGLEGGLGALVVSSWSHQWASLGAHTILICVAWMRVVPSV